MGLLAAGQAALIARQKQAAGRPVTYTRGGQSWTLTAWPGAQLFARAPTAQNGATVVRSEIDYLFAVADAAAAGVPLPPKRGDTITDAAIVDDATGQPKVFELVTPTGEPVWRYSDQFQTTVRVHCKRTGA